MHKIIRLILPLLLVAALMSCNLSDADDGASSVELADDGFMLIATVTDVSDRLTVDVISSEYAEGIYSVIIADDTVILDKNKNEITLADIHVGDRVKITYGSQTMMSYPPQIVATKIDLD